MIHPHGRTILLPVPSVKQHRIGSYATPPTTPFPASIGHKSSRTVFSMDPFAVPGRWQAMTRPRDPRGLVIAPSCQFIGRGNPFPPQARSMVCH